MFTSPLNRLVVTEHTRELRARGERDRRVSDAGTSPVTRVTLRYAAAADADRLRQLAALSSAPSPAGPVLVAEVDGRLRAALALDGERAIADPVHRGAELIELLRLRAMQLAR